MHRRLAADGISKERFREELRNQLLLQRLREREVESRVRVSDLDVDQYLREQQSGADASRLDINLGHVLVAVPENASPAQVAERRPAPAARPTRCAPAKTLPAGGRASIPTPRGQNGRRAAGPAPGRPLPRAVCHRHPARCPWAAWPGPCARARVSRAQAGGQVPHRHPGHGGAKPRAPHPAAHRAPSSPKRAAAARLADYRRRILAGQADFAELAREHSQDGSAKQGGDLGWANPGRYVPEFEQVLNALKPGEISEPLVSRFGVHLIQLLERREAKLTQREQRDMARDAVREKKLEEAYATWMQELRGRAYVEYREHRSEREAHCPQALWPAFSADGGIIERFGPS
jgi:peptidyl-prolyl cis-trans isomerase SurA